MFINFKEVKELISVERAMIFLELKGLKAENGSYRGGCPACRDGGSRALAITPAQSAFYCHAAKKGGDVISLTAHLHGTSMKEAASWLLAKSAKSTKPEKVEPKAGDFAPLTHLIFDHEKVRAIGLSPQEAEALGIGYSSRGYYKGEVVVPVRTDTGHLAGYIPIMAGIKLPKTWHLPKTNVVHLKRA
jgi:hypothetical protein